MVFSVTDKNTGKETDGFLASIFYPIKVMA